MNLSDLSIVNLPINTLTHLHQPEASVSKVIYYQGTFDPVHEGHISALVTAMEQTGANLAIVIADDGENLYKPNRTPWNIRLEMISKAFCHLKNVYVSTLSKDHLRTKLIERAYVITLIGSDIWPYFSKKKNISFPGICVCLRDSEISTQTTALEGKKITFIKPSVQGCSSTKIRNYLKLHPEIYENNLTQIIPETPLDKLELNVFEYIIANKIYYQSQLERLNKIKHKIKIFVSSNILKTQEFQFSCLTDIGLGGKSGDLTFVASSKDYKYFIKAYVRNTHQNDFKNELGGIKLLNELSLSWCKAIDPFIWEKTKSSYSHVGLPFLENLDLSRIFKGLSTQNTQEHGEKDKEFISMCFCVGRALSELHSSSFSTIDSLKLEKMTVKFNVHAQNCLIKLSKLLPSTEIQKLSDSFYQSYQEFLINPGYHTYAHGDANLSNFIVDLKTEKVILVDLERFFAMRTAIGSPLGFPAEDYHRFLAGLDWLNEQFPIHFLTLIAAKEAFKNGYQTFASNITPEAHAYFSAYWHLRNI